MSIKYILPINLILMHLLSAHTPQLKNKSHRLKSDHSIETKSPIKVPSQPEKPLLTFRKKSQFQEVQEVHDEGKKDNEREIIQDIWSGLEKLQNCNSEIIQKYVPSLQGILKDMVIAIAEKSLSQDEDEPLASSKKIKLQNLVCFSQYGDSHSSRVHEGNGLNSENYHDSKKSSKRKTENRGKRENKENTPRQNLEMKKILYMLQGKSKNSTQAFTNEETKEIEINQNLLRTFPNELYSSLSSFNQSPSQESGFTVLEIEKESPGCDSNSGSRRSVAELKLSCSSLGEQYSSQKCEKIQVEIEESRHENSSHRKEKRKVLDDIISMLNNKYNKNISLQ